MGKANVLLPKISIWLLQHMLYYIHGKIAFCKGLKVGYSLEKILQKYSLLYTLLLLLLRNHVNEI